MAVKGKHAKKSELDKKQLILIICAALLVVAAVVTAVAVLVPKDKSEETPQEPSEPTAEEQTEPEPAEPEKTDEPEPQEPDEPEPPAEEPDEPQEPDGQEEIAYTGPFDPLTGMPVEEDIASNRPYAVMLDNLSSATPQAGISNVDILYETLVEGGITRLMGVFQDISDVDVLGSVRSARPYFIDLAQGHDAIYIHAGGSSDAYTVIKNRGVTHIDGVNGSGETFYRDAWRRKNMGYEHSLMLDPALVPGFLEKNSLRAEHNDGYECNMQFADEVTLSERKAENITVTFSQLKTTSFEYSDEKKLYTASQYGSTMTDSVDGAAVRFRNIIVLYASISQIKGDDAGRLQMTLTGSGSGYFACDGHYTEISWRKDSYSSQFVYTLADNTEITFGRGATYVAIIPVSGGKVSFS